MFGHETKAVAQNAVGEAALASRILIGDGNGDQNSPPHCLPSSGRQVGRPSLLKQRSIVKRALLAPQIALAAFAALSSE
jgi:hypothetical protein